MQVGREEGHKGASMGGKRKDQQKRRKRKRKGKDWKEEEQGGREGGRRQRTGKKEEDKEKERTRRRKGRIWMENERREGGEKEEKCAVTAQVPQRKSQEGAQTQGHPLLVVTSPFSLS